MICHERIIKHVRPSEPIEIAIYGDVHFESEGCDLQALKSLLKEDARRKRYLLFPGDLFDLILPNDLKRFRPSALKWIITDPNTGRHRDTNSRKDAIVDMLVDDAYKLLKPYASRIIGIGFGNHEMSYIKRGYSDPIHGLINQLNKHTTSDARIAHLGYSAFLRLNIQPVRKQRGGTRTLTLYCHHGWGAGARTRGASITKYWRHLADYDAEVGIYAHDHKSQIDSSVKFEMIGRPPRTKSKKRLLVLSGTFLRTISDSIDPSYGEQKGYAPENIGRHVLWVKPIFNPAVPGYPLKYDVSFEGRE
jgi:hypothetical protein